MTQPRQTLRLTAYDLADALNVNELYQQKGWTDGLPIVPPTEERIIECLQASGLAAGGIVGVERIWQRPGSSTVNHQPHLLAYPRYPRQRHVANAVSDRPGIPMSPTATIHML